MQTITFSAIKGGVGKSSMAILTANILSAAGYKVLCIDGDPQNSMSFYYLPDTRDIKESLAEVLTGSSVEDNILQAENLSIIPSALELITCRDINPHTLGNALGSVSGKYNYCVIDTAPNFDGVTLNCLAAAEVIVTPVQFSNFDYKSAVFYRDLLRDIEIADKWKVLFNRFKPLKTGGSIAAEYLALYNNTFGSHILKSRIPESALIKQYFDISSRITTAKSKLNVFEALTGFVSEITGKKIKPEAF